MNSMWKRSFALLLSLVMVFGMVPVNAFAEDSGTVTCDRTAECLATADHAEDCLKAIADAKAAAKAAEEAAKAAEEAAAKAAEEAAKAAEEAAAKAAEEAAKAAEEAAAKATEESAKAAEEAAASAKKVAEVQAMIDALPAEVKRTELAAYEAAVNEITAIMVTMTEEETGKLTGLEKLYPTEIIEDTVAVIRDRHFATLDEAVVAAQSGDTITLMKAAELAFAHNPQSNNVYASVIDLNKKTLTIKKGDIRYHNTTIKNGDIVVAPESYGGTAVFLMYGKTLTLQDVNLTASGVSSAAYLIDLEQIEGEGVASNLNLIDSEIIIDNDSARKMTVVCANCDADITISNTNVTVKNLDGRVFHHGNYVISGNSTINLSGITKAGFRIAAGQTLEIKDGVTVNVEGTPRDGGIHLVDLTSVYTKADGATVNATINELPFVATIGAARYATLQAAVNAVKDGQTITLVTDITEDVQLSEAAGLHYTIDGAKKTMNGKIVVNSPSDSADRKITIQNINFKYEAEGDIINAVETNHYPHLTIIGCDFVGSGEGNTVAVRLKSSQDVVIKDCTGTGLHSFLQNTSGWDLTVDNVTVTDSKSGLALGTVQGVTVKNCDLTTTGYGIRLDAGYNNNAVIENCDVTAFIPLVVRKTDADTNITIQGSNTMTATNTDGYWAAIGASEYEENGSLPSAAGHKVTVRLKDAGLDEEGIYGYQVYSLEGEGTEANPYKIYTRAELEYFRDSVNDGTFVNKYVQLAEDIDLENEAWISIGTASKAFTGTFDGNGKTISNLKCVNGANGLFGYTSTGHRSENTPYNATIKNLTITNVTVDDSAQAHNGAGAVVGCGNKFTTISDVTVNGNINIVGARAGGVVGYAYHGLDIDNCHVNGGNAANSKIVALYWAAGGIGGFVSTTDSSSDVDSCSVKNVTIEARNNYGAGAVIGNCNDNDTFADITAENVIVTAKNHPEYNTMMSGGIITGNSWAKNVSLTVGGTAIAEPADMQATVGDVYYPSLKNAVAVGGNVKLLNDVTVTESVNVTKNATLDLNGKTITGNLDGVVVAASGAELTITDTSAEKNGKIVTTLEGGDAVSVRGTVKLNAGTLEGVNYAAVIYNDAKFEMNGGAAKAKYAVYPVRSGATFVLNDGEVTGSVTGNGTVNESDGTPKHGPTSITINGGTIKDTSAGIYHPQVGEITINGGTIEAPTGIELRSGKLTINGGTITATGTPASDKPNDSGTTMTGVAVGVSQHTTNKDIDVTIKGGTFNGVYALWEDDTVDEKTDNITLSLTGGTFNGKIASENVNGFIKGGNYKNDPTDYIAVGYEAPITDGYYVVGQKKAEEVRQEITGGVPVLKDETGAVVPNEVVKENAAVAEEVKDIIKTEDLDVAMDELAAHENTSGTTIVSNIKMEQLPSEEPNTVVYDITPVLQAVKVDSEGKQEVVAEAEISQLTEEITIKIPVPAKYKGKYVNLKHEHDGITEDKGDFLVQDTGNGCYIEYTTSKFSVFTVTGAGEEVVAHVGYGDEAVEYSTLQGAVDAANGKTVVLVKNNLTPDATITVGAGKTVTIDLNKLTLNGTILVDGGNLTIKNGTIQNKNAAASAIAISGGELSMSKMTVESAGTAVSVSGTAKAAITSGTYTAAGNAVALNVTGGTLVLTGGTYDMDCREYCKADYAPKNNGDGTWTVVKAGASAVINGKTEYFYSLAEAAEAAKAAAEAGKSVTEITRLRNNTDSSYDQPIEVRGVTIKGLGLNGTMEVVLGNDDVAKVYSDNTVKVTVGKAANDSSKYPSVEINTYESNGAKKTSQRVYVKDATVGITISKTTQDLDAAVEGEYMVDAGKNGIDSNDVYSWFENHTSEYKRGSAEGLKVTSTGFYNSCTEIKVDGVVIYTGNWKHDNIDVYPGSTVLVMSNKYLETLGNGDHIVTFTHKINGNTFTTSNTFKITAVYNANADKTNPKTGDEIFVPMFVMFSTAAALAVLVMGKKKYF